MLQPYFHTILIVILFDVFLGSSCSVLPRPKNKKNIRATNFFVNGPLVTKHRSMKYSPVENNFLRRSKHKVKPKMHYNMPKTFLLVLTDVSNDISDSEYTESDCVKPPKFALQPPEDGTKLSKYYLVTPYNTIQASKRPERSRDSVERIEIVDDWGLVDMSSELTEDRPVTVNNVQIKASQNHASISSRKNQLIASLKHQLNAIKNNKTLSKKDELKKKLPPLKRAHKMTTKKDQIRVTETKHHQRSKNDKVNLSSKINIKPKKINSIIDQLNELKKNELVKMLKEGNKKDRIQFIETKRSKNDKLLQSLKKIVNQRKNKSKNDQSSEPKTDALVKILKQGNKKDRIRLTETKRSTNDKLLQSLKKIVKQRKNKSKNDQSSKPEIKNINDQIRITELKHQQPSKNDKLLQSLKNIVRSKKNQSGELNTEEFMEILKQQLIPPDQSVDSEIDPQDDKSIDSIQDKPDQSIEQSGESMKEKLQKNRRLKINSKFSISDFIVK